MGSVKNIVATQNKIISVLGGDVFHAMKNKDDGYIGFGEAYFSTVERGAIKAWKRHLRMTLNLVVPIGQVLFYFVDDQGGQKKYLIGPENYLRLTVPPGIWFGFKGIGDNKNLLLNIADIAHDPEEIERKDPDEILVNWKE